MHGPRGVGGPARADAADCAALACLLEVTCRKPGNVHPGAAFSDCDYLDFLHSAVVIQPVMRRARRIGVGETVRQAVERTQHRVGRNTNLGMLLLLSPLVVAAQQIEVEFPESPRNEAPLRTRVERVLAAMDDHDAHAVYDAIREARAGGLGRIARHDVAQPPDIPLREAMRLTAPRDLVAQQYANGFADVFDEFSPLLAANVRCQGRQGGGFAHLEAAVVATFLGVLAAHPDSLIARKCGLAVAEEASRRAQRVLTVGGPATTEGQAALNAFDDWLRDDGNRRNPGTTADLVTATLFCHLWLGHLPVPIAG